MRHMTTTQLQAAQHGAQLGLLCLAVDVSSTGHLRALLSIAGHPLSNLLSMVLHSRPRRSRRYDWRQVLRHLNDTTVDTPPWVRDLLERTFALYRLLRHAAGPQGVMPQLQTEAEFVAPRALRRALRHAGVRVPYDDLHTVHEQAMTLWLVLWRSLANRYAVLWFDNFYKPRYLANPGRAQGSLNCTVMAVLHTPRWPATRGHPRWRTWCGGPTGRLRKWCSGCPRCGTQCATSGRSR